jgi:hypothetical protein
MQSVFQKFGGIRPMAGRLGEPSSTVKSWHVKRRIPRWRHQSILEAAAADAIELTEDELINVREDESAEQQAAA